MRKKGDGRKPNKVKFLVKWINEGRKWGSRRSLSLPALHLFPSLVTGLVRKLLLFPDKAPPHTLCYSENTFTSVCPFYSLTSSGAPNFYFFFFPSTALFFLSPVFVPLLRLTLHPSHRSFIKKKSDKTVHPRTQGYKLGCVCVCARGSGCVSAAPYTPPAVVAPSFRRAVLFCKGTHTALGGRGGSALPIFCLQRSVIKAEWGRSGARCVRECKQWRDGGCFDDMLWLRAATAGDLNL